MLTSEGPPPSSSIDWWPGVLSHFSSSSDHHQRPPISCYVQLAVVLFQINSFSSKHLAAIISDLATNLYCPPHIPQGIAVVTGDHMQPWPWKSDNFQATLYCCFVLYFWGATALLQQFILLAESPVAGPGAGEIMVITLKYKYQTFKLILIGVDARCAFWTRTQRKHSKPIEVRIEDIKS